jgi:hypothetical protein
MIRDLDIYRSAQVLIREHGENAALEAAMWADAILEKGDLAVCCRVPERDRMSASGYKRTF